MLFPKKVLKNKKWGLKRRIRAVGKHSVYKSCLKHVHMTIDKVLQGGKIPIFCIP